MSSAATFPPPYAPREHAQVVSTPAASTTATNAAEPMEFSESTSICLEWRLTGLKAMYDSTKGETKSKCVKSAVFGDADNLWEVLWYANSGVSGGDYASLYLSCVPTPQEREQGIGNKWTRKGLWWFRFEIKSLVPDRNTNKIVTLATKDAADHAFAVKTANWGWQQFAKRDGLFLNSAVQAADGFVITCTIQAQPQPPAGYWLGMGLPATSPIAAVTTVGAKTVGSGGGLSAWAGGAGAGGGVAGGAAAGGGVKRVVPNDLVSAVGSMLGDPIYSDVEFVFPQSAGAREGGSKKKRIYATKKLLIRYDYFQAMFEGGFGESDSVIDDDADEDDILDLLCDSDVEDEADTSPRLHQSNTYERTTSATNRPSASPRAPSPPASASHSNDGDSEEPPTRSSIERDDGADGITGEEHGEDSPEEPDASTPTNKREATAPMATPPIRQEGDQPPGPKKMKIVIRDAAWSTWWSLLYWIYTDIIYFAPLTSSFPPTSARAQPTHSRTGSSASFSTPAAEATSRRDWIQQWLDERDIDDEDDEIPTGPRPVSAKAIYRLADKLDLPALKIRAFQHICSQLTAQNIPAEVFSRFSSMFEDVRKVQVAFFLKHWSEIKKSETMTQIWQQIRVGKHIGFEEVWPLIVGQLEFKQA